MKKILMLLFALCLVALFVALAYGWYVTDCVSILVLAICAALACTLPMALFFDILDEEKEEKIIKP